MTTTKFTPEEIALYEADAAEARHGYSVEYLDSLPKTRLRGRPVEIGETAAVLVRLRMDPDRLQRVDERAKAEHKTRSQFIRDAVDRELLAA